MTKITASDITSTIGTKTIAARLKTGEWVLARKTSAFLAPLEADVLRSLTCDEAASCDLCLGDIEAAVGARAAVAAILA